jgi:NAD(P)-dependent dehydrogenase (short-subunit alcohol dehydrogenase family)
MERTVVLISGGTEGLGKAIAQALAKEHAVVILAPDKAETDRVAQELGCEGIACDVTDYDACERVVADIIKKHGALDCLVNNAGVWIGGDLDTNEPRAIERAVAVNLIGTINLTRAALPEMKRRGRGRIVNICSQSGLYPRPGRSVYAATKWGVTGFTKSLERELGNSGIAVTGIYPGKMNTKMLEKAGTHTDLSDAVDPNDVAKILTFILSFTNEIGFPEIGIKHIRH